MSAVSVVVMQFLNQFREDLHEVAKLVSAITGSHSSAIFIPADLIGQDGAYSQSITSAANQRAIQRDLRDAIPLKQVLQPGIDPKSAAVDLIAAHSTSTLVRDCRVPVGHGLVGWVAEQGRPIHLSPCDVSSSALSIYVDQEPIKSLVAVPIFTEGGLRQGQYSRTTSALQNPPLPLGSCGVLMCDSTRVDGFTNAHVKILEQFAAMIQRFLCWSQKAGHGAQIETSWEIFKQKTIQLGDAIGHNSIEIVRIKLESLRELEALGGVSLAVQISEQFTRLTQQAVPPHFPCIRLPDGDIVLAVDDMMSSFFQQKLQSLANHLSSADKPVRINIECYRARLGPGGMCTIDATLQQKPISVKTSANLGGVRA
jgi:hypothetical protein